LITYVFKLLITYSPDLHFCKPGIFFASPIYHLNFVKLRFQTTEIALSDLFNMKVFSLKR